MGFFSFLDPALGFIFNPFLGLPSFWTVIFISFIIAAVIVLIYKFTTNQKLMKDLKDEIKALQKEMKELRGEPEKAMHVQKRAMEVNMKYMMHSFKPTLITFLPIILIFSWMTSHLAFAPITPFQDFTATVDFNGDFSGDITLDAPEGVTILGNSTRSVKDGSVVFSMNGAEGDYILDFLVDGNPYDKEVKIDKRFYAPPAKTFKEGVVKSITLSNQKNIVMNLFGWRLGWFGTYIIFSILFSMILRKLLRVY